MGSRYGRNQKRKHREQIAAQAKTLLSAGRQIDDQARRISRIEHDQHLWDQRIRDLLGQYSAFRRDIDPKFCKEIDHFFRMNVSKSLEELISLGPIPASTSIDSYVLPNPINLIHFLETIDDDDLTFMRRIITLRLQSQYEKDHYCYAVSEEQLQINVADNRYFEELALHIARDLRALIDRQGTKWSPKRKANANRAASVGL